MEQLADHLVLREFNVAGHSGGGPHALSIAHYLPERVSKVALASQVAPFDEKQVTSMLVLKDLKTTEQACPLQPSDSRASRRACKSESRYGDDRESWYSAETH